MTGLLFCLIGLLAFPLGQERWKEIVPLRSSRTEVEALLGSPVRSCTLSCFYNYGEGRIFVHYSGPACEGENSWRIQKDTVMALSVYPGKVITLSSLRLDRRKFKKTSDPELPGYYSLEDIKKGVSYSFSDKDEVTGISFFGSADDDQRLRCKNGPAN